MRSVAYREFSHLVHGKIGKNRIPLPACAYHKIRSTFQPKDNQSFVGFQEDEIDDWYVICQKSIMTVCPLIGFLYFLDNLWRFCGPSLDACKVCIVAEPCLLPCPLEPCLQHPSCRVYIGNVYFKWTIFSGLAVYWFVLIYETALVPSTWHCWRDILNNHAFPLVPLVNGLLSGLLVKHRVHWLRGHAI